jgi:hypothetical protein
MDKETLIKVVAIIDREITQKLRTDFVSELEEYDAVYNEGYIDALEGTKNYFQSAIDADVATMESATGE